MTGMCSHRTVGVLIYRDDRLLITEHGTAGPGLAPITGHVDPRGGYQETAHRLLHRAALTPPSLTQVADGWRDDRCDLPARAAVVGHNWRIYTGQVHLPAADDATASRWVTREQLQAAADQTVTYALGAMSDEQFAHRPGLEPVWVGWLAGIGALSISAEYQALVAQVAARGSNRLASGGDR